MNPGEVVLIPLPQVSGGPAKLRPALMLAQLPGPFQSLLIRGISTRLHDVVADWDELVRMSDADFRGSGLRRESVIWLSYLYAADVTEVTGTIGQIAPARLSRLLTRLADHLHP